jgi:hypothetical protein
MKELLPLRVDYLEELQPETELEYMLLRDPEFTTGLGWGIPRYGHPEGEVYKHIREVLENVDLLQLAPKERQQLRLIAFAHDTFKYKEAKGYPRDLLDLLRRDHRGFKMALFRPHCAFFRSLSPAMLPQKAFVWTENSSFFPPR